MPWIACVTTLNIEGLRRYGVRMLESFDRCWPADVGLIVYAEGFDGAAELAHLSDRVVFRDLSAVEWRRFFLQAYGRDLMANGRARDPRTPGREVYDYRYDAVRFSHKVAAMIDAFLDPIGDPEYLIWIDADTFTHRTLPADVLESWLPGSSCLSILNRNGLHPECGFWIVNRGHYYATDFILEYKKMYEWGHLFNLPEWHDSYIFGWIVARRMKIFGSKFGVMSLSGRYSAAAHPFVKGPLGAFMDHLKGDRKSNERSHDASTSVIHPDVPYWNQISDRVAGR